MNANKNFLTSQMGRKAMAKSVKTKLLLLKISILRGTKSQPLQQIYSIQTFERVQWNKIAQLENLLWLDLEKRARSFLRTLKLFLELFSFSYWNFSCKENFKKWSACIRMKSLKSCKSKIFEMSRFIFYFSVEKQFKQWL